MFIARICCIFTVCSGLLLTHESVIIAQDESVNELRQLQESLQAIQQRIERLNSQAKAEQSGNSGSDRVRVIGSYTKPAVLEPDVEELQIRFYDLTDIFSTSPQYPAVEPEMFIKPGVVAFPQSLTSSRSGSSGGGGFGGGGMGGGGGMFNIASSVSSNSTEAGVNTLRVSLSQLSGVIQRTVEPEAWVDAGGESTIQLLGSTFLISAPEPSHEKIENLLDLFRERWGALRTVSVRGYWIRADAADIDELLGGQTPDGAAVVDDEKWKAFYQQSREDKRVSWSFALTGHSGQTLNSISGRQTTVATDVEPIAAVTYTKDGLEQREIVAIKPVLSRIQLGSAIQVTPLATRGGNFVMMDVHARINQPISQEIAADDSKTEVEEKNSEKQTDTVEIQKEVTDAKIAATDSNVLAMVPVGERYGKGVAIERYEFQTSRLSTTVRCPNGRVVLAGGMTFDDSKSTDSPELYLFVQTRIHTIKQDEPQK